MQKKFVALCLRVQFFLANPVYRLLRAFANDFDSLRIVSLLAIYVAF